MTTRERLGRPVCNGVALYDRPFSPCRGCPDASKCAWCSLKNPVCMRYMETVRKLKEEAEA